MCKKHNPRKIGNRYKFPKGYTPWNKGLTKKIDKRLVRTEEYKKSMIGSGNTFYGKKHTEESKIKIASRYYPKGKEHPFFGKHIWKEKRHPRGMLNKQNKWGKHTVAEREKIKTARAKQIFPVKDTKIEVKIQMFLKELGYNFFTHQYIKEIEHGYQCDILIPALNLIIECDGNYWHNYPIGKEIDNIRTKELIKKGFKVLRLWEHDINQMTINQFGLLLSDYRCDSQGYYYIPEVIK